MPIPTPTAETRTPMTVAALRRRLQPGVVVRVVFRWYWEKRGIVGPQYLCVRKAGTQSVHFRDAHTPDGPGSWMTYPTRKNGYRIWATDKGFELEVEPGFTNRYEWTDEGESAS